MVGAHCEGETCNVPAVVPSVAGQAWITELSTVDLDPTDPFPEGVKLTDTWPIGFYLDG